MKIKNPFPLLTLISGLALLPALEATAQTITTLHSFGATPTDGLQPSGGLILAENILYGTTDGGGSSSNGAVFAIQTGGAGYTNLYGFSAAHTNSAGIYTNSDGSNPGAGFVPGGHLVLSSNILYGTAFNGGSGGCGTVFKVHTDGSGFSNLYSFTALVSITNSDGANPDHDLILASNTLYGTAVDGGSFGYGTVFRVNTDGTGFTNLHSFTTQTNSFGSFAQTNYDGAAPVGGLVLLGHTLYGSTDNGGVRGGGTVFAVNTDGTSFTVLHSFDLNTRSDGVYPDGGLVLSGHTLYGPTEAGGLYENGTVFKVDTDGENFANLHSFAAGSTNISGLTTNSDGAIPWAALTLSGGPLYGTANTGGTGGTGTAFALNTDGTGFMTLYSFAAGKTNSAGAYTNSDGAFPYAGLAISGNVLYGATATGGNYGVPYSGDIDFGSGALFSLTLVRPQLTLLRSGLNVILSWPTNTTEFILQSTTNIDSSAAWSSVSPGAVIVNEQNTVTNPISGAQRFYRLSQ